MSYPLWPYASNYDLHEKAGGSPLQVFTAPNVRHMSQHRREVCNPTGKLTSRNKNVGPKGHITHQAGRTFNRPLLQRKAAP